MKIDSLVKMNVEELVRQGILSLRKCQGLCGFTDRRLGACLPRSQGPYSSFNNAAWLLCARVTIHSEKGDENEDNGWLLTFVFDESQLDVPGECGAWARSELWMIELRNMKDVVAKIHLPQWVPYGFHGNWFFEDKIRGQRPFNNVPHLPSSKGS